MVVTKKKVNISAFLIESFVGIQCNVGCVLNSMKSAKLEIANDSYTLATLPNNAEVIFKLTRIFLIKIMIKEKHFSSLTR